MLRKISGPEVWRIFFQVYTFAQGGKAVPSKLTHRFSPS